MTVNYSFLKSMKGTAVGTIVPWTGNLTEIPVGWLPCDGRNLNVEEYPVLYGILGVRYGGTGGLAGTFNLPPSTGAVGLVDYHTVHTALPGTPMPTIFRNMIDNANDRPNDTSTNRTSNIDLRVNLTSGSTYVGTLRGNTLNPPAYTESITIFGRLLGDLHTGSHGHPGSFNSLGRPNAWVEECQGNFFSNCAFNCPDDCGTVSFYGVEANTDNDNRQRVIISDREGGSRLVFGTAANILGGDYIRRTSPRNFLNAADDTFCSTGLRYATSLNHNQVNFVSNLGSHTHPSPTYELTIGGMRAPNSITINNVSSGSAAPINATNQNIATVRASVATATCSVFHIIRAY